MSLLSERLYALRKAKNISLQTLYLQTGISTASLSAYERDKYAPSIENLCLLASFYKITLDELLAPSEADSKNIFPIPLKRRTKQLTSEDIPDAP